MTGGAVEARTRSETMGTTTVLHVDDDPMFLEVTRGILQQRGMEVASESDPRAVSGRLDDESVTALISDYEMPEMAGDRLFERVRRDHPSLPFVLFTGKERGELSMEFESTEATWYVQKRGPGGYDRLVDVVSEAVERDHTGALVTGSGDRPR